MHSPLKMIDLDALEEKEWTKEDELYCYFGSALCLNRLNYIQFLALRGNYLADRYVYPMNRTINKDLISCLVQIQAFETNIAWLFTLYLNVSHVHAHYTEVEQIRILEILRKTEILRKNAAMLA